MASQWNRNAHYGGGYMGSGGMGGVGFYMGGPPPADRRPYNDFPVRKPYYGGYRDDGYSRRAPDRRDDIRGGKRGPPKDRSPIERRYHDSPIQRKERRSFGRRSNIGKYEVRVPKTMFNVKTRAVTELHQAHPRLNLGSDFYECTSSWVDTFPLHSPLKLGNGTDYHVFHRDVDAPSAADSSLINPPDADYSYSARVMLLACPLLPELYKATCRTADEPESTDKMPAGKNVHFLVGGRAKCETMAIGGPWSPSLDGPDPSNNPKTLINTAIRTFKGYTGLDLASCTEWLRFMEIKYYRFADTKVPGYTEDEERLVTSEGPEVVVFFIPCVSHLLPSEEEWNKTKEYYTNILQGLLNPEEKTPAEATQDAEAEVTAADATNDDGEEVPHTDLEPTHYSKLDINSLKVNELRNELASRKLDTKGLKVNLVARLQAAIEEERKADLSEEARSESGQKAEESPVKTTAMSVTDESTELNEKARRRLERLYRLPDKPAILIHPNRSARGGRFDCHRVSLFSLLDYRTEEQKEQNFEVSLFAEQFNQMLQRDCAFTIFKAVHDAPEKEHKTEQGTKDENGVAEDEKEPDTKRRRDDSQSAHSQEVDSVKIRKLRRTVNPDLLFAFTFFDTGRAGYVREHDLCEILHLLGLDYSRAQMKKLVTKVANKRDVQYHELTDGDIVEGDENDVTNLLVKNKEDNEVTKMLALGNRALFDTSQPEPPSRIIVGGDNTSDLLTRLEKAEDVKNRIEHQFFKIKDELEKTRVAMNSFKDTEDALRTENADLTARLKSEQKIAHEHRNLSNTYNHLLRFARDQMDRVLFDINKQFDKEKAKREAERAAAEAEASKNEPSEKKAEDAEAPEKDSTTEEKVDEKEWEVVDAV